MCLSGGRRSKSRLAWRLGDMMAGMTTKTFKHGTSGYVHHKCRCDVCRAAKSAAAAKYRADNIERVKARDAEYRAANKEKIAESAASHYSRNRARVKAKSSAYYAANREQVAARRAEYCVANREDIAAYQAEYRAANRGKLAAYGAEYRAANPEVYRAAGLRRRARKADNGVWDILPGEWERVAARYRGCCAYCGVEDDNLEMDHVVPVAKGGGHRIGNFVPACRSCNSSKNDRFLSEWKLWKVKVGK